MKKSKRLQSNQGSTLVMVIMIITFLAILASTLMMMAFANLQAKIVDRQAKNTFYTVEGWYDQMSSAMNQDALKFLEEAYDNTLAYAKETDVTSKYYIPPTSEHYNIAMRNEYMKRVSKGIFVPTYLGGTANGQDVRQNTMEVLEQYLLMMLGPAFTKTDDFTYEDSTAKAVLKLKNAVGIDLKGEDASFIQMLKQCKTAEEVEDLGFQQFEKIQAIVFKGVELSYTVDGFTQVVKSDMVMNRPAFAISFDNTVAQQYADNSAILDYTLVAAGEADASTSTLTGGNIVLDTISGAAIGRNPKLTVAGSVYSGNSILSQGDSEIEIKGTVKDEDITRVVADVISASRGGSIGLGTNDIPVNAWATTIRTGTPVEPVNQNLAGFNSAINVKTGALYVKDDTELNEDNSTFSLKGSYYGYRGAGDNDENGALENSDSSAMIINGKNTNMSLEARNPSDYLVINGKAYLNVNDKRKYQTGESISFKGNQSAYMAETNDITNGIQTASGSVLDTFKVYTTDSSGKSDFIEFQNLLKREEPLVAYTKQGAANGADVYTYYSFDTGTYPDAITDFFAQYVKPESRRFFVFDPKDGEFQVNQVIINYRDENIYASGAISRNEAFQTGSQNYTNRYSDNSAYFSLASQTEGFLDRFYFARGTFNNPLVRDSVASGSSVRVFSQTEIRQSNRALIGGTYTDEDLQKPYLNAFEDAMDVGYINSIKMMDPKRYVGDIDHVLGIMRNDFASVDGAGEEELEVLAQVINSKSPAAPLDRTNTNTVVAIGAGDVDGKLKIDKDFLADLSYVETASGTTTYYAKGIIITTADIEIDLENANLEFDGVILTSGNIAVNSATTVKYNEQVLNNVTQTGVLDSRIVRECFNGLKDTVMSTRNLSGFDSEIMLTYEQWEKFSE